MSIVFPSLQFPQIETNRLVLRQLTPADNYQLLAIRNNEEINRFIGRSATQTIDTVNQFIAARQQDRLDGKGVYWAIELKATAGIIGTICIWNLDYDTLSTEFGYELLPAQQGKGLMTEAVEAVITFGFQDMLLDAITAWCLPQNQPSVRLLERHGFNYSETIDGHLIYKLNKASRQVHLNQ